MEIADRDFFGKAAVIFIRFRVDGEKTNVIGVHLVVLYQAVADRRSRRTEGSFSADLNRHDDEPRQRVDDQLDVIEMRRSGRAQLGVFQLLLG